MRKIKKPIHNSQRSIIAVESYIKESRYLLGRVWAKWEKTRLSHFCFKSTATTMTMSLRGEKPQLNLVNFLLSFLHRLAIWIRDFSLNSLLIWIELDLECNSPRCKFPSITWDMRQRAEKWKMSRRRANDQQTDLVSGDDVVGAVCELQNDEKWEMSWSMQC